MDDSNFIIKHDQKSYDRIFNTSSKDEVLSRRQDMGYCQKERDRCQTIERHRTLKHNNNQIGRKYCCRQIREQYDNGSDLCTKNHSESIDLEYSDVLCSSCDQVINGDSQRGSAASVMRSVPRFGKGAILFDKCTWPSVMLIVLLVIEVCLKGVHCARSSVSPEYVEDNVQDYLTNFGYLPQSGSEAGNLRTEDQLREAIRNLQKFGHIPATGKIDERTKELLTKPRCGLPDYTEHPRRMKRFVQQGAVWNHTDLTWRMNDLLQTLEGRQERLPIKPLTGRCL